MLMLTRRKGESVDLCVDGAVIATVKVLELLPDGVVRLGFEADRSVDIRRDNMVKTRSREDGYESDENETFGNR
jgi:sRNA-binding carbon storage regulator CsrA